MSKPVALLSATMLAFFMSFSLFGFRTTYLIGYGAFILMAATISLTFFWLWLRRATPLAMGMAFSWAGAAGIMGWWWFYKTLNAPEWMRNSQFLFPLLSVYFLGAILHLEVIARSFGARKGSCLIPIILCFVVSIVVFLIS